MADFCTLTYSISAVLPGHGNIYKCGHLPTCRHYHRYKQAEGWWLEQPEPGILKWRTPAGRTATSTPTEYSLI